MAFDAMEGVDGDGDFDAVDFIAGAEFVFFRGVFVEGVAAVDVDVARAGNSTEDESDVSLGP